MPSPRSVTGVPGGTALGGMEWGSAADNQNAYFPVSDVLMPAAESGGLHAVARVSQDGCVGNPVSFFEQVGGEETFHRIVARFYKEVKADEVLLLRVHREDQQPRFRIVSENLARRFDAGVARHREVHEHDVGLQPRRRLHDLRAVLALADDGEGVLLGQQLGE